MSLDTKQRTLTVVPLALTVVGALVLGALVCYYIFEALAIGAVLEGSQGSDALSAVRGVAVLAVVVLTARLTIPRLRASGAPRWLFHALSAAAFCLTAGIVTQSFVMGDMFADHAAVALLLDAVLWAVASSVGGWWGRTTRA